MNTKSLEGSWSRDKWKYLHKQVFIDFFTAIDNDLTLTDNLHRRLLGHTDIKKTHEKLTNSETIAYDHYLERGDKTFIVRGDKLDAMRDRKIDSLDDLKAAISIIKGYKVYEYHRGGKEELVSDNYYDWECRLRGRDPDEIEKRVLNDFSSHRTKDEHSSFLERIDLFSKDR